MDIILKLGLAVIRAFNKIKLSEPPLPILYFHRVLSESSLYQPDDWTRDKFDELISCLNNHFTIMPISTALALQKAKSLPTNALSISFDDGYIDNFENAVPILEKYNVKASFFVATQGTERGFLWNDKLENTLRNTSKRELVCFGRKFNCESEQERANAYLTLVGLLKVLPNNERDFKLSSIVSQLGEYEINTCMMNSKQLMELESKGHDVGAHTCSHSILAYQSDEVAEFEIGQSIKYLNDILNTPVKLFAYPNGWYGRDFFDRHERMLTQNGVKFGLATNDGGVTSISKKTALPRFMPHRKELNQFCLSIAKIAGE